jgi:sterol desaturase/sphingolipid hydroxylase (fatty acid hydroxylase superfamily)
MTGACGNIGQTQGGGFISVSLIRIESGAYWVVLAAAFLSVAVWESFRAKRELMVSPSRRWGNHGLVFVAGTLLSLIVYRGSPLLIAAWAEGNRFALLNRAWLPFPVRCIVAFLLLDLVRYGLHRLVHSVTLLWRFHQVHHSDPDFDVSTTFRVHPIELVVTSAGYFGAIVILGAPPLAVLIAELANVAVGIWTHANASLPEWLDKPLRLIFVTPDMHRIHHSEEIQEQNRNLGEIFPWWDRLFGTYVSVPAAGEGMVLGMSGLQNEGSLSFAFMLKQPFLRERGERAPATTEIEKGN